MVTNLGPVVIGNRNRRLAIGMTVNGNGQGGGGLVTIVVSDCVAEDVFQRVTILQRVHFRIAVVQLVAVTAVRLKYQTAVLASDRCGQIAIGHMITRRNAARLNATNLRAIGTLGIRLVVGRLAGQYVARDRVRCGVFRNAVLIGNRDRNVVHDGDGYRIGDGVAVAVLAGIGKAVCDVVSSRAVRQGIAVVTIFIDGEGAIVGRNIGCRYRRDTTRQDDLAGGGMAVIAFLRATRQAAFRHGFSDRSLDNAHVGYVDGQRCAGFITITVTHGVGEHILSIGTDGVRRRHVGVATVRVQRQVTVLAVNPAAYATAGSGPRIAGNNAHYGAGIGPAVSASRVVGQKTVCGIDREGRAFGNPACVRRCGRYIVFYLYLKRAVAGRIPRIDHAQRDLQQQRLVFTAAVSAVAGQGVGVAQFTGGGHAAYRVGCREAGQDQLSTLHQDGCRRVDAQGLEIGHAKALASNGDTVQAVCSCDGHRAIGRFAITRGVTAGAQAAFVDGDVTINTGTVLIVRCYGWCTISAAFDRDGQGRGVPVTKIGRA